MTNATQSFYDTHADEYFRATAELTLAPQWETLAGRLRPGARILDLGSGSGRDLRFFAGRGFQVVGVDYSQGLLKLSQQFTQQPAVLGDLTTLPFQDHMFDAAWAIGSLLHVAPSMLPVALRGVHRVLRPGGLFFASVKQGTGECLESSGRETFFHSTEDWTCLLRRYDFQIIGCRVNVEERRTKQGTMSSIEWIETLTRTSSK